MKTILCFGDSNTYGLKPDGTGRYDHTVRYPCRLQALLGEEYRIIEEGCPGRTTVFDDISNPYKKGIDYFIPCLRSHTPLDYIIIMLGTNDCKTVYNASPKDIADGIAALVSAARKITPASKTLIVSPILLGESVWKPGFDTEFDENSVVTSKGLAAEHKKVADRTSSLFLNAAEVATASPIDEEHLDEQGHLSLASAVSEIIIKN
jgi:lysophospholipase L1-like esterase